MLEDGATFPSRVISHWEFSKINGKQEWDEHGNLPSTPEESANSAGPQIGAETTQFHAFVK